MLVLKHSCVCSPTEPLAWLHTEKKSVFHRSRPHDGRSAVLSTPPDTSSVFCDTEQQKARFISPFEQTTVTRNLIAFISPSATSITVWQSLFASERISKKPLLPDVIHYRRRGRIAWYVGLFVRSLLGLSFIFLCSGNVLLPSQEKMKGKYVTHMTTILLMTAGRREAEQLWCSVWERLGVQLPPGFSVKMSSGTSDHADVDHPSQDMLDWQYMWHIQITDVNICRNCHGRPSHICWDVWLWTKVPDWLLTWQNIRIYNLSLSGLRSAYSAKLKLSDEICVLLIALFDLFKLKNQNILNSSYPSSCQPCGQNNKYC